MRAKGIGILALAAGLLWSVPCLGDKSADLRLLVPPLLDSLEEAVPLGVKGPAEPSPEVMLWDRRPPPTGLDKEEPSWSLNPFSESFIGRRDTDTYRYTLALSLLSRQEYARASELLEKLLEETPESRLAQAAGYWRAEAALGTGDWHGARSRFAEAAAGDPGDGLAGQALLALAWMSYQEEDWPRAAGHLEEFLRRSPEEQEWKGLVSEAWWRLGLVRYRAGDYRDAAAAVQSSLDTDRGNGGADQRVLWLAESRYQSGDYAQAAAHYLDYARREPAEERAGEALHGAAWSALTRGMPEEAARLFAQSAGLLGSRPPARESRYLAGRARALVSRPDGARELLAFASEDDGGGLVPEALVSAGMLLLEEGDFAAAQAALVSCAERFPGEPLSRVAEYLAGKAALAAGDCAAATAALGRLAARPDAPTALVPRALLKIGYCSHLQGRYPAAVKTLRSLVVAFPDSDCSSEADYWLAESYYRLENLSQALFLYRALAAQGGERADDALYGLGWVLRLRGEWNQAAEAFGSLLSAHPDSPFAGEAGLREAEALLNDDRPSAALTRLAEVRERFPLHREMDELLFLEGLSALRAGFPGRAREVLGVLVGEHPESGRIPEARYHLGLALAVQGECSSALGLFDDLAREHQGESLGWRSLLGVGDCRLAEGRFSDAARAYDTVLDGGPGKAENLRDDALYGRARAALGLGEEGAFELVERFGSEFPGDRRRAALMREAALAASKGGDHGASRLWYERLVEELPDGELKGEALLGMGEELLLEGDHARAVLALRRAAREFPESGPADRVHYRLGSALAVLGDFRGAMDSFGVVVRDHPQSPFLAEALLEDGLAALEAGETKRAGERLREFTKRFPAHPRIHRARLEAARLELGGGRHRPALDMLGLVVAGAAEETAAAAQFEIGKTYLAMGEPDRAVIEFLKVAGLYPRQVSLGLEARLAAALVYAEAGKREEALDLIEAVVAHPEAGAFRERAEELRERLGGAP